MKKSFKRSDLDILLQIFIPSKYILSVHDTENVLVNDTEESAIDMVEKKAGTLSVLANFSESTVNKLKFDYILDFGNLKISHFQRKNFGYIHNPDKTLRWVFPSDIVAPTFLNFYNSTGFKAMVLSSFLKLAYRVRLGRFLTSGRFNVYYRQPLKIDSKIEKVPHDCYSIFTGTVGPNRKILVELNTDGISTHFGKWAISENSKKLVRNEFQCIKELQSLNLAHSSVPISEDNSDSDFVLYRNIKPEKYIVSASISDIHISALEEIYDKTITYESYASSAFRLKVKEAIQSLKVDERISGSERMIKMLKEASKVLSFDYEVPCATAHCDFTPWNMYQGMDKLYLYDWELSRTKMPLLFDLFHYIFQKCILIDRTDLNTIKSEIAIAIKLPAAKRIIELYNVDVKVLYHAYVLYNVSYYMRIYSAQENLHSQVFWLFGVWQKALEDILMNNGASQRKNFISYLIGHLDQFDYALMKFSEGTLASLGETSDLDILIKKKNLYEILRYIKGTPGIQKIGVIRKSFMTTIILFFEDGSFLSIDLIYEFKRKADVLFSASIILQSVCKTEEGVKVPQKHHDFEYMILFYQLNGSDVPQKYVHHFESLKTSEQVAIRSYLISKYHLTLHQSESPFVYTTRIKSKIQSSIDLMSHNSGWGKLVSSFNYLKDIVNEVISNRGIVVTVSGIDGAGKSTIIEDLRNTFSQKFRKKVIVLRHRPSLFPILSAWKHGKQAAESMASQRMPRQGTNNSLISSSFRFAYYYADYIIGQVYIYFRYVLRGYTVIYDRYYFDFISDHKRSNIKINREIVSWLYAFVYKPSLNILLYAPSEVIIKRKQELAEADIKLLTKDYLNLFSKLALGSKGSKYLAIENLDRKATLDKIIKEYVEVA